MGFRYSEPDRLLIGYSSEPVFAHLLKSPDLGEDVSHLALDQIEQTSTLAVSVIDGCLVVSCQEFGTLLLGPGVPVYSRTFVRTDEPAGAANVRAFLAALCVWANQSPKGAVLINRPTPSGAYASKLSHLRELAEVGFRTPPAVLSTASLVLARHSRGAISKGVSGTRSIASRDFQRELYLAEPQLRTPGFLQTYIAGDDVRAHFVGLECFALKISTRADDYRYARRSGATVSYEEVELPADIKDLCWRYMRLAGIEFGGFDFKVDASGQYWVLECNFMPGYAFFDEHHGGAISAAILRYLRKGYSALHWAEGVESLVHQDRIPRLNVGSPGEARTAP